MGEDALLLTGLGLLGAALLLLMAEVFIPSGGLLGLGSAAAAIGGIVVLFRYNQTWGLLGILGVLVMGPMAFGFALKIWPSTPIGRRMLLGDRTEEDIAKEQQALREQQERLRALVGAQGVALTPLRPVGTIQLGNQRFDALSEIDLIEPGEKVVVVEARDNQIKVRKADSQA